MCNLIYVFMQYDACLIMSGIGYRAKIEKTPETFNAFPCIGAAKSWAAQSVFDIYANWNLTAARWLKYYIYLRLLDRNLPKGKPQVKAYLTTFAVSALWHGLYPGNLFLGIGAALSGLVWQKMERSLLHHQMKTGCNSVLFAVFSHLLTLSQLSFSIEFMYAKTLAYSLNFFWAIAYQKFMFDVIAFTVFSILPKRPRTQVKDGKKELSQDDKKVVQESDSIDKTEQSKKDR